MESLVRPSNGDDDVRSNCGVYVVQGGDYNLGGTNDNGKDTEGDQEVALEEDVLAEVVIVVEQNPKMPLTEYHVHNLEEIRRMTLQVGAAGYHNARPVQVQSPKVFRTVGSKCNYEWHANPWKLPEIL